MDAKELKSVLKSARECIRNKEYKDALKHCMTILKNDKENYNALVFMGVAAEGLGQPRQALSAYRKAIESDDSQILAWQGMCSLFEKSDNAENYGELAGVYQKLVHFHQKDEKKMLEIQGKLLEVYEKLGQFDEAFALISQLLHNSSKEDAEEINMWRRLIAVSSKCTKLSSEDISLVLKGYQLVLKDAEESEADKMVAEYLEFLSQSNADTETLVRECQSVQSKYPDSLAAVKLLSQIYLFSVIVNDPQSTVDVSDVQKKLEESGEETVYRYCLSACGEMSLKKYADAKNTLLKGLQKDNGFLPACVLLSKAQLAIHDLQAAEKCLQKARHLLECKDMKTCGYSRKSLMTTLDIALARIMVEKKEDATVQDSLKMCEEIIEGGSNNTEVLVTKAKALIHLQQFEAAVEVVEQVKYVQETAAACLEGLLHVNKGDNVQAEQSFTKVLSAEEDNAIALFHLGKIYWERRKQDKDFEEKCLSSLLKAAKGDPYSSLCFLYLGHYYAEVQKDLVKAKKCYQKSYNLDSRNEETGVALVDVLNSLGQEDSALDILQSVTSRASAGTCKWAWLRLGLHQMKHDDPTKAIFSLQSALRADPKDYHCWECLGEAYLNRGSYTAACKAFTKATELQPDNIYSFYQIATIKLTLGVYPEAIVDYRKILDTSPDYVPALKGLGETYLLQTRAALREFFHGRAIDYCKEAITALTRAAHKKPEFSCLWKLLGDCCTVVSVVPAELCVMEVPALLLGSGKSLQEMVKLSKTDIMGLGARCYGMSLKAQSDCAPLWHDLGVNYYHQAKQGEKMNAKTLMGKAFQALEKALQLDSSNHKYWNALGLVTLSKEIDNKALAQHCFIKSVQAEQNNVVAWTNLGILYLRSDDVQLAHEAFKVAQSLEPSYVASWIGQALIAETVGQGEEAMDLFRHTTELTTHTEGALGYAHWVCSVLQDKEKCETDWNKYIIEHMYAVAAASDVLAKYTDRIKTNPIAFNLYGLLLERQKLFKDSAKAFHSAVKLLNGSSSSGSELRKVQLNLARVLVHNSEFERAIKIYQDVKVRTFEEQCGYALALYKMGDYASSFKQYETSLSLAKNEEDRSHVYAAMGIVQYKTGMKESGRGDIDGAKTELFKCIQASPPSVHGLNGLLSLGLIQGDLTLATAAVQELQQFVQPESSQDFTYMVASLHALKGETTEGKRHLAKLIHSRPDKALAWSYMVQYLLSNETDLTDTVRRCCHIGLNLDIKKQYQNLSSWLALALLGTGQHSRNKPENSCYSAAQKAVFLYPDKLESWVGLISSMYAEIITRRCLNHRENIHSALLPLITHFMAKVEGYLSLKEGNTPRLQALHLWCVKQYVVALLASDRRDQAEQFLQQALWLYEQDQPLQNLLAFLNQNFSVLKINAINDSHGFTRQMLVKLFLIHGLVDEAESTLKMWLPQARTKPRKVLALVRIAFFSFKHIVKGEKTDQMRAMFKEASEECIKIDSQVSIIHFLTAMLAVLDENNKQSKKSLQTALKYGPECEGLTYGRTMARKHLLKILLEKGDSYEENVQELIQQAQSDGDVDFVTHASQFVKIKEKKQEE